MRTPVVFIMNYFLETTLSENLCLELTGEVKKKGGTKHCDSGREESYRNKRGLGRMIQILKAIQKNKTALILKIMVFFHDSFGPSHR